MFSERIGITKPKKIQIESMDSDLRNTLWNTYNLFVLGKFHFYSDTEESKYRYFYYKINQKCIKRVTDTDHLAHYKNYIKEHFLICEWNKVYDLIDYTVELVREDFSNSIDVLEFISTINNVLEVESSGYRFIDGQLAPITNPIEIEEIEHAMALGETFTALKGCSNHLDEALRKISDRQNPDYRNSIKESISAVESISKAICGLVSNKTAPTLKPALDKIESKLKIHHDLKDGFKKIYDYTSDEDGVRHSMADDPNCDFEDAKFMLVACSAFVNYLVAKANKAGIELTPISEQGDS